jgi:nucleotide-binding universal stress UspA family protein
MIETILLAVDTGSGDHQAERLAAELATSLGAEVLVLHVREWLLGLGGPFDEGEGRTANLVRDVAERLRARGLRVRYETTATYFAFTARRIVDAARAEGADLIVLGPHPRSRLLRSALGTDVSGRGAAESQVPVLVAQGEPVPVPS